MAAKTPYLTSRDLINSIKRKIAIPISQITFTEDDILDFANEEMMISQVPSILEYHEEYFVFLENVPLKPNKTNYTIPNRAIGMRLRDVSYVDNQGNNYEMTRINPDDKSYFQRGISSSNYLAAYYLQGNQVILTPNNVTNPTGYLQFSYFLRPNQLVLNERAAIAQNFNKTVTIDITQLVPGDQLAIDQEKFTAVASAPGPNEFLIDVTDVLTATSLANSINTNGYITATQTVPATSVVNLVYPIRITSVTTLSLGMTIQTGIGIIFDNIPDNITNGSLVDFLETLPGHRTYIFDVKIASNGINAPIINFTDNQVPDSFLIGDYIASANECIIPQIPPDLHNGLAERTSGRILASLGDQEGLGNVNQKIAEIDKRQGNLLDQRIDGAPQKIVNRHSNLRYSKSRIWGKW